MLLNLTENEFYFVQEAFCGLEYAENAFVAGALPETPMGSLRRSPRPLSRPAPSQTSPHSVASAPRPSRIRC